MSNREQLTRTIYFRRLVTIDRTRRPNFAGLRLWRLRMLYQRAHAMALARG